MPGRKRVPTGLKIINGNPGRRPIPNEPQLEVTKPEPPDHLAPEAVLEWNRLVELLYTSGLMTGADVGALASYCAAYGRWVQAERKLNEAAKADPVTCGLVQMTTHGNYVQNPLVGIANKAHNDVMRYAAEFGMTPASRSKVDVSKKESSNPFDNLKNKRA